MQCKSSFMTLLVLLNWIMEYMKHTEWGSQEKWSTKAHAHKVFHLTENYDYAQCQITEGQKMRMTLIYM